MSSRITTHIYHVCTYPKCQQKIVHNLVRFGKRGYCSVLGFAFLTRPYCLEYHNKIIHQPRFSVQYYTEYRLDDFVIRPLIMAN